jgi:hypothetical protein
MHGTSSAELGSSKHGSCKLFGCQLPTFKVKSRMLRVKNKKLAILRVASINLGSSKHR